MQSSQRRVYLDYSATTPCAPEVVDAVAESLRRVYGNASSVHAVGREAKVVLEESRKVIADALGAAKDEIVFTSGGSESDNFALKGAVAASKKERKHVIVSAIEHDAILKPAETLAGLGCEVTYVRVDADGRVDPDDIRAAIRPETVLISVMHVNNETGIVQPVKEIASLAREYGVFFHSDCVQSFGKIPVNVSEIPADVVSISAHKIYGPKGIGALYVRKGSSLQPLLEGGAQELNRRAGTENVPLAVGFARAVDIAMKRREHDFTTISALSRRLRQGLSRYGDLIHWNGLPDTSIPHIVNVSFDTSKRRIDGEALIIGMDLRGVCVTSGSACSSGSLQSSHVLIAMGRSPASAKATIRFSIGRYTTEDEITFALSALDDVLRPMV